MMVGTLSLLLGLLISLLISVASRLSRSKTPAHGSKNHTCGVGIIRIEPPPINLSSRVPTGVNTILHIDDKTLLYLEDHNLVKLSLVERNLIERSVIPVGHPVKSIQQHHDLILIQTTGATPEVDEAYLLNGSNMVKIQLVDVRGICNGVLLDGHGRAYHICPLDSVRFHSTLELASTLNLEVKSFQEIKINKTNGEVWRISNTRGLDIVKLQ